jgi:hypothetical protein
MKFVANYEVKAECSVIEDERVLRIKHPKGLYSARIQNIPRSVFTTPFLISFHLYFESPALNEAKEIADSLLADCLNMLALTTGASFKKHRIRQIVDATLNQGMRDVLMWSDAIEYEDPQPFLSEDTVVSIEKLLEFDIPPAIRRAMRWYRLGINATVPDDQFMNFWFALEIIAEFQKSPEKVTDKCPKCRTALYCETCKIQPVHRPFAKQAIHALLREVDEKCDDETIKRLEDTRNSLMHGSTLKEIEGSLPDPHEQIVDILGRLLWKALVHQFPKEFFKKDIVLGYPNTFVHHTVNAICHVKTIVQADDKGEFDLDFKGTQATIVPFGPPQSAAPTIIRMNVVQYKRLEKLSYTKGDHQDVCTRIYKRVKEHQGQVYAQVLSTDMKLIHEAVENGGNDEWPALFREILSKLC